MTNALTPCGRVLLEKLQVAQMSRNLVPLWKPEVKLLLLQNSVTVSYPVPDDPANVLKHTLFIINHNSAVLSYHPLHYSKVASFLQIFSTEFQYAFPI
jgi:hypothetical protein